MQAISILASQLLTELASSNPENRMSVQMSVDDILSCGFVDSESSAATEISTFFPDFSIEQFYSSTEPSFRQSKVVFDADSRTHRPHL